MSSRRGRRRRSIRLLYQQIDCSLRLICDRLTNEADHYPLDEELNLFQHNIGEDGAEAVAIALSKNKKVKMLYMGWNAIGNIGVEALSQEALLSNSSIVEVYLENNGISLAGATQLGRALAHNTSIRKLVLQGNQICGAGAQSLANGLTSNRTLQVLILASNVIGNQGASAFGHALARNKSLKLLDLERNGIGPAGVAVIAQTLEQDNVTLEALDLYGNSIGNEGAASLKTMLQRNQYIKEVDLAVNQITKAGTMEIIEGLKDNTGLRRLHFYGNDIEFAGASALSRVLEQGENKTLSSLIIGGFENSYWGEQRHIDYFCARNKAGWRFIGNVALPVALWPQILQKVCRKPSLLYGFLRERPDLFKRGAVETPTQDVTRRGTKKRSHDELSSL